MTASITPNAPITKTLRVSIRTNSAVVASDLDIDEALAYITEHTPVGLSVVLPSGGMMQADGPHFRMWATSLKAAIARATALKRAALNDPARVEAGARVIVTLDAPNKDPEFFVGTVSGTYRKDDGDMAALIEVDDQSLRAIHTRLFADIIVPSEVRGDVILCTALNLSTRNPRTVDDLAARSGLSSDEVIHALAVMLVTGTARQSYRGFTKVVGA